MNRPILVVIGKVVVCALVFTFASAQTFPLKKRKKNIPGQRAVVYDERLSALRTQPDIKAKLISRLRRDREVGILGGPRSINDGPLFYPVAISRNMRGWIIAEALARPQKNHDATRLMHLLEDTKDEYSRIRLARLYADQYRGKELAPRALLVLGASAEQAAVRLSREAQRRLGEPNDGLDKRLSGRAYVLNYVGLDRYNRLGVTFDYDEARQQLIYDGSVYREILRKYPHSKEAMEARDRLEKITGNVAPRSAVGR